MTFRGSPFAFLGMLLVQRRFGHELTEQRLQPVDSIFNRRVRHGSFSGASAGYPGAIPPQAGIPQRPPEL